MIIRELVTAGIPALLKYLKQQREKKKAKKTNKLKKD